MISLLGSRKSDNFTPQPCQGNAFPRLLTWQGGREPEHLHPLAKDHEEMFNWHLELSSVAGWGSQALLHPMETSPQFSLQFLESSPPNPWVQCGILTETSAHHSWNSLS